MTTEMTTELTTEPTTEPTTDLNTGLTTDLTLGTTQPIITTIAITSDADRKAALEEADRLSGALANSPDGQLRRDLMTAVSRYDAAKIRSVIAEFEETHWAPASVPSAPSAQHDAIMQFFAFEHLRPEFQETSRMFANLAYWIEANLPRNAERSVALRKLLESKDAAVRAKLIRD